MVFYKIWDKSNNKINSTSNNNNILKTQLKSINNKSIKYISMVVFFVVIIMNLIYFFLNYKVPLSYNLIDISLIGFSSFAYFFALKYKKEKSSFFYNYFYSLAAFILIFIMGIHGILELKEYGNMGIYLGAFIACSAALVLKPKCSFFVYTIPQVLFLAFLKYKPILGISYINTFKDIFIFTVCAIVINYIHYRNQTLLILKNIILKEKNEEIRKLSQYDSLTGMANRRYFQELIGKQKSLNGFLALMDLDFFKKINDTHGHLNGDIVLKKVAELIKIRLAKNNLAARWGGEEFIVYFPQTSQEQTFEILEKMRKEIEDIQIELSNGCKINITISIGFSLVSSNQTMDHSFLMADTALYKAKETRNAVIYMN